RLGPSQKGRSALSTRHRRNYAWPKKGAALGIPLATHLELLWARAHWTSGTKRNLRGVVTMGTVGLVLAMLAAVIMSGLVARALPFNLPRPVVQIGFGAFIGAVSRTPVKLDPDVFFLLFLPPLLFLDGWRIPNEGLRRDRGLILQLALGLVFFTVLGMGFFIHWMIPAIPLPAAFALAAIVSPTDPVAVSAIAARVPIPPRVMHRLEGESLLNDASGLV